ncbi:hypothetical protein O7627_33430 [Solwaraspora sp. WMMD1047]|uniref:hypothetical protein n=1 Tax=Solwaraspora sp. WMMD1047 TaxID=3016102 RepID=UPI002416EC7D|nr:hypothetical protein [Solwaraspora sp. WMMD1047]MDG4834169.1 hypothetical protein [Solwaraspora sp. WMMD1047]
MSFHTETTHAGYARAAVDLRIQMAEVANSVTGKAYVREFLAGPLTATPDHDGPAMACVLPLSASRAYSDSS